MRWTIHKKPNNTKLLAKELNVEEAIASILHQRSITNFDEARQFFRPSLQDLHNPYLMKDMDKAVSRIDQAIRNQENILIFGDYDVDGTSAVSLVSSYLKSFYPNVATYIPDRYSEGYGISFQGIDFADDNGFSLIVALDCGIKSIEHIEYAKQKGIDFIICDHHRPGNELPDAVAILNPKRDDCSYPYDELCGCGIGFKLIQALAQSNNQSIDELVPYLDLVAVATAADIVPITGENRVLCTFGLEVINTSPRIGIKALIENIKKTKLSITDVVFVIAPRINAAGRIKHGNHAVELLSENNIEQAQEFAKTIEQYNTERRDLDKQITQEALMEIKPNEQCYTTVVCNPNWHKGVIGIVASRLIETYYKPTLVFTQSGDKLVGSGRSIKNVDLYSALEQCSEYLEQFGGHMYAAGMTLKPENYQQFKTAFEKAIKNTTNPALFVPEIVIDAEIDFSQITPKFIRIINQFEPFGPKNMKPVFLSKNVFDTGYAKLIGSNDEHLKLFVKQKNTEAFAAIGFNLGNKIDLVANSKPFQMVFSIEENEWNGTVTPQLRIRDIKAM